MIADLRASRLFVWLTSERHAGGDLSGELSGNGRVHWIVEKFSPSCSEWLVRRKLLTASKENATGSRLHVRSRGGILHGRIASAAISVVLSGLRATREKCKCCRRRHFAGYPLARDSPNNPSLATPSASDTKRARLRRSQVSLREWPAQDKPML